MGRNRKKRFKRERGPRDTNASAPHFAITLSVEGASNKKPFLRRGAFKRNSFSCGPPTHGNPGIRTKSGIGSQQDAKRSQPEAKIQASRAGARHTCNGK